jgi:hypothetical protein
MYWAFVDDGEIIQVSQRMNANLSLLDQGKVLEWLKDPAVGRFRPGYWLYHFFAYRVSGINHFGHGFIQLLLMVLTVIFIYLIVKAISKSQRASLLAGVFFLVNTLNQENWYRLGPQEAPMLFFLAAGILSILYFIKAVLGEVGLENAVVGVNGLSIGSFLRAVPSLKNLFYFRNKRELFYFLSAIVLVTPAYFIKETTLAYLAFPVFIYLWSCLISDSSSKSIKSKLFIFLIWNVFLAIVVRYFVMSAFSNQSYAANYLLEWANIKSNFFSYIRDIWITFEPIIIVAGIGSFLEFILFVFSKKPVIKQKEFWLFTALVLAISFFAIQLPWRYSVTRYLFPTLYFLAIFLGIQIDKILLFFEKSIKKDPMPEIHFGATSYFGLFLIWGSILVVGWYNLIMIYGYTNRVYRLSNDFNKSLIEFLSANTAKNGKVYLDTPPDTALELKQEIGLHMNLFYNRNDVSVVYYNPSVVKQINPGDVLLRAGEFKQVSKDYELRNLRLSSPKRIDIELVNKLYYPPLQLVKDYVNKWFWNLLIKGTVDFNPVLSVSQDNYFWQIYDVEGKKI